MAAAEHPLGPEFDIAIASTGNRRTVALSGELDMANADGVIATLTALCDEGVEAITIDLHDLSFMDSFGLRALLAGRAYCAEHDVSFSIIDRLRDEIRRLLDIAGVAFELALGADDAGTVPPV